MAKGFRGGQSKTAGGTKSSVTAKQYAHLDKWSEPPSLSDQLGHYTGQTDSAALNDQISAVKNYSGSDYVNIRNAQYNNDTDSPYYKQAEAIERMIDVSPKWDGGDLYRGIRVNNADLSQFQVGATIDMRGISSWSTSKTTADNFSTVKWGDRTGVLFRTKGTKKGASISHLSKHGKKEGEVLVSSSATWHITKITTNKAGKMVIDIVED